ncbi:MAG: FkbM family methyltransferase [Cyclobacteriaceae bacterium]
MPIQMGKHRIAFWLHKTTGPATYFFKGVYLALSPFEFFWKRYMESNLNDPEVYDSIEKYLKEGAIFLDIGANMGVFSLLAAKQKNARVFAFEPSFRELQRFHHNITINPTIGDKITVFPYGLADREKTQTFYLSPAHHSGMNSVLDLSSITKENTPVQCHFNKISNLLSVAMLQQVALCKIDVEGYEVEVLRGLEESMPYLNEAVFIVEISPAYLKQAGATKEDIYEFFGRWNFTGSDSPPTDGRQYNELFIRK